MKMFGSQILSRVKWHMYHLDEIKNAVFWRRQEMKKRRFNLEGIKPRGVPSDPTANEAIMNATPLKAVDVRNGVVFRPEAWIEAITSITSRLNKDEMAFFSAVFQNQKSPEAICDLFSMSRGTFFRRRDDYITLCAIAAAERGLIKIADEAQPET